MEKYRKRFFSAILNEEQGTVDFVLKVNELGVDFEFIGDAEEFIKNYSKEFIIKEGVSQLLENDLILAHVLYPAKKPFLLIKTIGDMLSALQANKSLTIIDRFLFPKKYDEDYVENLEYLIMPFVKRSLEITFIIETKCNCDLLYRFISKLKMCNKNCVVNAIKTDDYHDRFWLLDGEKGLFVGTSLNGVGKKYAIVDCLKTQDAIEIFNSINRHGRLQCR